MAIPSAELAAIRTFCERRVPTRQQDQVRVDVAVRGNSVTIVELRPLFAQVSDEWVSRRVAQLRYEPGDGTWTLHWRDRQDRWQPLESVPPGTLDATLDQLTQDATGVFWG